MLALKVQEAGKDVDFATVWGKGHAGDYDLDDLFAWMIGSDIDKGRRAVVLRQPVFYVIIKGTISVDNERR